MFSHISCSRQRRRRRRGTTDTIQRSRKTLAKVSAAASHSTTTLSLTVMFCVKRVFFPAYVAAPFFKASISRFVCLWTCGFREFRPSRETAAAVAVGPLENTTVSSLSYLITKIRVRPEISEWKTTLVLNRVMLEEQFSPEMIWLYFMKSIQAVLTYLIGKIGER